MQACCQCVRNLPSLSHQEQCGEPWRKEGMLSPARKTWWKRQISPTGGQMKLPWESPSYNLICNGLMNWILGLLTTHLNSSTSIFKIYLKRICFFLQFWMFLWQNHFFSSGLCLLSLNKEAARADELLSAEGGTRPISELRYIFSLLQKWNLIKSNSECIVLFLGV